MERKHAGACAVMHAHHKVNAMGPHLFRVFPGQFPFLYFPGIPVHSLVFVLHRFTPAT